MLVILWILLIDKELSTGRQSRDVGEYVTPSSLYDSDSWMFKARLRKRVEAFYMECVIAGDALGKK